MPERQSDVPEKRLWVNATSAKICERADGKARVCFMRRDDGLFQFQEEHDRLERGGPYWLPVRTSGFYDSLENAEADAVNSISWLMKHMLTEK